MAASPAWKLSSGLTVMDSGSEGAGVPDSLPPHAATMPLTSKDNAKDLRTLILL